MNTSSTPALGSVDNTIHFTTANELQQRAVSRMAEGRGSVNELWMYYGLHGNNQISGEAQDVLWNLEESKVRFADNPLGTTESAVIRRHHRSVV